MFVNSAASTFHIWHMHHACTPQHCLCQGLAAGVVQIVASQAWLHIIYGMHRLCRNGCLLVVSLCLPEQPDVISTNVLSGMHSYHSM